MPLKEEALMIADSLDPLVKRINAANTLIFEDHEISAYSTDVSGFAQALTKAEIVIPNEITILGGELLRVLRLLLLIVAVERLRFIVAVYQELLN